jgi:ribonuclease T1
MTKHSQRMVALALAVLLVLGGIALVISNIRGASADPSTAANEQAVAARCVIVTPDVPGARESGLRTQPLCALPPEVAAAARAIQAGGPFQYQQDGATFRNAEQHLPSKPLGYYREYTVPTPGSADRGARRLIAGSSGEFYYTADHYVSFVVVDTRATGNG